MQAKLFLDHQYCTISLLRHWFYNIEMSFSFMSFCIWKNLLEL